jgi:Zn-dependent peptidase ImmA (M78 family)/transcriptional regulator with XRE-family HTH domain
MLIGQDQLGSRLREARTACNLTQQEVAERLGVPRTAVLQMEQGNRRVSSVELEKLAYLYGRDVKALLAEDSPPDQDSLAALFRRHPDVADQDEVIEALRACVRLGREISSLEGLLDLDRIAAPVASYPFPAPRKVWEAIQQGARAAEEERRRLGLGDVPVTDLAEILESQGVRTALVDLPEDVSGLTIMDADVGPFVVVNRRHHVLRRRFSYAHEYGHVLMDRSGPGVVSRASQQDDLIEVRTNVFAAAFLLPEDGVRRFVAKLGKGGESRAMAAIDSGDDVLRVRARTQPGTQDVQLYDVALLAHHFSVSRQTALYRLKNLKLVTDEELSRLLEEDRERGNPVAKSLGLREPDHTAARNEFAHRFLGLGVEAYRRGLISRSKLVELGELLGEHEEHVVDLLENAGLADSEPADVSIPET